MLALLAGGFSWLPAVSSDIILASSAFVCS
jgi:hypothetical protein